MKLSFLNMVFVGFLCVLSLVSGAIFPACPPDCPGTSAHRQESARDAVAKLNLNQPWTKVRKEVTRACGLNIQPSTDHCFADFNHVDCCTMVNEHTHRTNEESRVPGMHTQNQV
jgi:hypothetical protein